MFFQFFNICKRTNNANNATGSMNCEDTVRHRGMAAGNSQTSGWVTLSPKDKERLKELERKKKNARKYQERDTDTGRSPQCG